MKNTSLLRIFAVLFIIVGLFNSSVMIAGNMDALVDAVVHDNLSGVKSNIDSFKGLSKKLAEKHYKTLIKAATKNANKVGSNDEVLKFLKESAKKDGIDIK